MMVKIERNNNKWEVNGTPFSKCNFIEIAFLNEFFYNKKIEVAKIEELNNQLKIKK